MKDRILYLHGLNGLRAIAALSVLLAHISLNGSADFGLPQMLVLPMGEFGITLFFVISGFLITYLLVQEMDKRTYVDVRKFYMRRILRIWPIYYLCLIVSIMVFVLFGRANEVILNEMWFYIFFAANIPFIFENGILILVHYWSIGVEEQFYLFWPWIVRFSKNKLFNISIIIFLILFFTKIGLWWFLGSQSYGYRFISVTRFHCMMIGAVGAILYFNNQIRFTNLFSSKIVQFVSWMLFFLIDFKIIHVPAVIAHEIIAIASLSMIMGQVMAKKRIINLENRFCNFIGRISYGIYVIHPLIILLLSELYKNLNMDLNLKYVLVYSTVVIVTIFVAWLSFVFFESPFLGLKNKFMIIRSSNSNFKSN